jgi:hypothetical protein
MTRPVPSHPTLLAGLVALAIAAGTPSALHAQERKPRDVSQLNLGQDRLALQGYDPVAYFPEGGGRPREGLASITATHDGVLYRFASAQNRQLFAKDPQRFEPQYGGWCAYAMADTKKVEIDPRSFLVTDGRLYLFFKAWYADTRAKWLKDEQRLTAKADKAWKKLIEAPDPERSR